MLFRTVNYVLAEIEDVWNCGLRMGILRTIKEKVKNGAKTKILDLCNNNIENLNIDMVFHALVNGDELAKEILESASNYLGIAIANLINLYDPRLVVFGGNFAKMSKLFIEKLKEKICISFINRRRSNYILIDRRQYSPFRGNYPGS